MAPLPALPAETPAMIRPAQADPMAARQATASASLYYIGRNSRGRWVVRDATGRCGGIFTDRAQAIKFAMFENGRHPEAVIMVPGPLELELI